MGQSFKLRILAGAAFGILATPAVAQAPAPPPASQPTDETPTAATASEVASPAEGSTVIEDEPIIVTGSRIVRQEFAFPNPVQSYTSASIEQSGDTNITDFLLDSPALVGSLTGEFSSGSEAGFQEAGLNLLSLRNLGTARTLVLVNGRRHVNAFPGENSVDINTIPVDLLERVDILTGGASAIYGADGVSGVVNFVLKRDFEGIRARGQVGISEEGDAGNRFGSIIAGRNFADDRANVTIAYEFNESDRLNDRDRPYTGDPARRLELLRDPDDFPDDPAVPDRRLFNNVGWADSSQNGAIDVGSFDEETGEFVIGAFDAVPEYEGDGDPYDGGTFLSGTGGRAINGSSNTPTAGYFGDFAPYLRRHNVNLLTQFEISPAVRLFAEGKYVDTTAFTIAQPSFDFGTYLTPENPFVAQRFGALAPDGLLFNRDNFDLGVSSEFAERETLRGVLGVDGTLTQGEDSGNLRYELAYVYGRSRSTVTSANTRVTDRYFAALDAVVNPSNGQVTCRINLPGETIIDENNYAGIAEINAVPVSGAPLTFAPGQCVPLNLLGEGVASQAAIDFVMVDSITRARSTQHVVTGSVAGDLGFLFELPGGPIGFALGAEYREESTRSTPSAFQQLGAFDGGSSIFTSSGKFDVKEAFGELNVPILSDVPFAQTLSIGGALRFSDYSTVGSTTTYKIDGVYAPVRDITFRGTYSQAVRAPNITELFSPAQGTFQFLFDPCDPTNIGEGPAPATRAANCLATLQALGLTPAEIAAFSPATDAEQSTSQPGLSSGNPDLTEETAKTWTAGVVLRPRFLPGFTLAVDWYDIKIKDAINTPTSTELLELCVDQPSLDNIFCANVGRDPETGFVNRFLVQAANVASFTTSGLDIALNYQFEISPRWGTVNLKFVGGYLDDLTFISTAGGAPDQDRNEAGAAAPKYVGTADLTWTVGDLTLNYGLSWQGKTRRFTTDELRANPDLSDSRYFFYKERWEHDIQASYRLSDRFGIYGGVNNLTDQQPGVAALGGYPVSTVGRFFYVGARMGFDRF